MKEVYSHNAKTNVSIRYAIKQSNLTQKELAKKYDISITTVAKWKRRRDKYDRSSIPNTIHYALTDKEKKTIISIRKRSWLPLDEITNEMQKVNPSIYRSAVYRTLRAAGLNRLPNK
jgi:transposase